MADKLEQRVIELEKRAKAAEAKLANLGSSSTGGGADDAATLKRLNEIREAVLADQLEAQTVAAKNADLETENAKLKDEVGKLQYQILHLKRSLEATDPK